MCRAIKCKKCGKVTWSGCGQHVDQVMAGVSEDDKCKCDHSAAKKSWLSKWLS
ncbi:MAG: hypothetical protein U0R17_02335 [Acidimicrobiia bacterium]